MADAQDVHIVVVVKEDDDEDTTQAEENTTVPVKLTIDLDAVEVKTRNAYTVLSNVDHDDTGVALDGATIENVGDGYIRVDLECGDTAIFKAEPVISAAIKALELDVVVDND